jgi:hypothetical protein
MVHDMAGDGYQHRTAWAGVGNGVLVLDTAGNGQITQRNQIVFTDWDPNAETDMQAPADVFDSNGNGKYAPQCEHKANDPGRIRNDSDQDLLQLRPCSPNCVHNASLYVGQQTRFVRSGIKSYSKSASTRQTAYTTLG